MRSVKWLRQVTFLFSFVVLFRSSSGFFAKFGPSVKCKWLSEEFCCVPMLSWSRKFLVGAIYVLKECNSNLSKNLLKVLKPLKRASLQFSLNKFIRILMQVLISNEVCSKIENQMIKNRLRLMFSNLESHRSIRREDLLWRSFPWFYIMVISNRLTLTIIVVIITILSAYVDDYKQFRELKCNQPIQ